MDFDGVCILCHFCFDSEIGHVMTTSDSTNHYLNRFDGYGMRMKWVYPKNSMKFWLNMMSKR